MNVSNDLLIILLSYDEVSAFPLLMKVRNSHLLTDVLSKRKLKLFSLVIFWAYFVIFLFKKF